MGVSSTISTIVWSKATAQQPQDSHQPMYDALSNALLAPLFSCFPDNKRVFRQKDIPLIFFGQQLWLHSDFNHGRISTKLNPDINVFWELEKEENLLPSPRQMKPDLKVDDFERMKKTQDLHDLEFLGTCFCILFLCYAISDNSKVAIWCFKSN